MVFSQD
jgi:hypothetical protein